jgi:hypothetical protein
VTSSTGGLALRWGAVQYGAMVECFRLRSSESWVDVCLLEVNGRWIATAETPDGPTLGTGTSSLEALWGALDPFRDVIGELLASMDEQVAS